MPTGEHRSLFLPSDLVLSASAPTHSPPPGGRQMPLRGIGRCHCPLPQAGGLLGEGLPPKWGGKTTLDHLGVRKHMPERPGLVVRGLHGVGGSKCCGGRGGSPRCGPLLTFPSAGTARGLPAEWQIRGPRAKESCRGHSLALGPSAPGHWAEGGPYVQRLSLGPGGPHPGWVAVGEAEAVGVDSQASPACRPQPPGVPEPRPGTWCPACLGPLCRPPRSAGPLSPDWPSGGGSRGGAHAPSGGITPT